MQKIVVRVEAAKPAAQPAPYVESVYVPEGRVAVVLGMRMVVVR